MEIISFPQEKASSPAISDKARIFTCLTDNYKTVVSTTQKLTHDNPTIFPDPRTFLPERWLNPADQKRLEKYLKPFGRGSRACIGQQYDVHSPSV